MKINVDLQLLLYLMGYQDPIIYTLWSMVLEKKNDEERTLFIENIIKLLLAGSIEDEDLDLEVLE